MMMRASQLKAALVEINAAKISVKKAWFQINAYEDIPNTSKINGVPNYVCTVAELEDFVRFVACRLVDSFSGDAKRESKIPANVRALCTWVA